MEEGDSFTGALRSAQLIDLQDGSALQLPDTEYLVAVGLTVDDRLSFTINPHDDDLVLTLCHVQRKDDGHWFFPSVFLPCLLNETQAVGESLLSQGSTFSVGDREVRYSIPLESRLRLESESKKSSGPPPKPRRTSLNLDAAPPLKQPMSPIVEETADGEPTVSTDNDLIQHLSSPEEVAQLACSYVCHQVALYTDLLLSTEELDFLFKAILAAGETCRVQLREFVTRYNDAQENQTINASEIWPLHGPVIYLLKELLEENLDSVRYATLWIKLLATFANFSPNLPALIQHQVAPVILGSMAVHSQTAALQQYSCTVLTQLATYTPPVGQKGPVREGGVDLVTFALTNHVHETLVLRPALRTLANLTNTYSAAANEALTLGSYSQGLPDDTHTVVLQEVERSMGILDFIEEHALPVVMETMEHHLRDLAIQTEGRRLLAFFVDEEMKMTRKKSVNMMTKGRPKVRFQLDPNDPTWIVATDHDSTDSTDDEEEAMRRMSTVSLLSLNSAPLVGRLQMDDSIPEDSNTYSDGQEQDDQSSPGEERPRRKLGMVQGPGGGSRVGGLVAPMVFEFESWDDEKPVMRSSAPVGIRRIEDLMAEESDEEIIGPLPPLSTLQLPSGVTSLLDELTEIGAGTGIYAEVDMEYQSTTADNSNNPNSLSPIRVASPQTEPIYAEVNKVRKARGTEYTDGLNDCGLPLVAASTELHAGEKSLMDELTETQPFPLEDPSEGNMYAEVDMEVDGVTRSDPEKPPLVEDSTTIAEPIYAEIQDVPGKETAAIPNTEKEEPQRKESTGKESSLKRGMKRFLKPGRMFSKMKQRLKFKELRTKEDQLLESAKAGADPAKVGDNGGDGAPASEDAETPVVDHTEEVCLIAGVTIDDSVTDDVTVTDDSNMTSESVRVSEVGSNQVSTDMETANTKAPPLFVEPEEPAVKGSKNTVVNLIDRWKRKEKSPSVSERGAVKKPALRKQWRPFEQMDSTKTEEQASVERPSLQTANQDGELMVNAGSSITANHSSDYKPSNDGHSNQNDTLTGKADGSSEDTRLKYLSQKSNRRTLGSLAMLPDVERFLTSARPSIADAGELATWTSSYNAMSGEDVEDMDLEAEQAVRVNRTKWKSVVAEMKDKVRTNTFPFTLRTGESDAPVDPHSMQYQLTNDSVGVTAPPLTTQRRVSQINNRPNALNFPEIRSPEYRDRNILTAKALITCHVLDVWHTSPSLASAVLGARTSDCLSVCGVAPDIILSIRDDFNLKLPLNKGHLEFSSSLMDILIGLPTGDETRMELLDLLQELLSVSAHPYHQQVAARCGWALLTDSLPDLTTSPTGTAILQELLDCTERRLSEVDRTSWQGHQPALSTFRDRLNVWLHQEVWL